MVATRMNKGNYPFDVVCGHLYWVPARCRVKVTLCHTSSCYKWFTHITVSKDIRQGLRPGEQDEVLLTFRREDYLES